MAGHGTGLLGRLSVIIGAIFLNLAVTNFSPVWEERIMRSRQAIWTVLTILYIGYLLFIVNAPEIVTGLEQTSTLSTGLALVTVLILLSALWGGLQQFRLKPNRLTFTLTLAISWLVFAQISQWAAPIWRASWWLVSHVDACGVYAYHMGLNNGI